MSALFVLLALTAYPRPAVTLGKPAPLVNGAFTVLIDGREIFYVVGGTGPVCMVLTNSWGLSHEGVRRLFRPLEEHLTMVYFDPRGMGRSSPATEAADRSMAAVRQDFDALRRHLNQDRVHAIGWSNGAMNLLLYAAENPQALTSAIFLHGVANFTAEDLARTRERHGPFLERLGGFMANLFNGEGSDDQKNAKLKDFVLREWFPYLYMDRNFGKKNLVELFDTQVFSWRHLHYQNAVDMAQFDATGGLAKIECPALVIAGQHDLMPPEKLAQIHEALPHSRFIVFEHSGHFAPVEERERFVNTVVAFLGNL